MPAAPLDVDWEAVEAHAIQHGPREAARAFGISANTVLARCAKGGWLKDAGKTITVQSLPTSMIPKAIKTISAPDAARNSMGSMLSRTRLNMAKVADKGFRGAARMQPERIIASATDLKALAGVAQVAHPELREDSQPKGPLVSLHFNALPIVPVVEQNVPFLPSDG